MCMLEGAVVDIGGIAMRYRVKKGGYFPAHVVEVVIPFAGAVSVLRLINTSFAYLDPIQGLT